jgi:hypothetical protein
MPITAITTSRALQVTGELPNRSCGPPYLISGSDKLVILIYVVLGENFTASLAKEQSRIR